MANRRLLACALLLLAGCNPHPGTELDLQRATLFSREKHGSYEKATYSFERGVQGAVGAGNDWDIEFGNPVDAFGVTMATDDASRILDLGWTTWSSLNLDTLPELAAHPEPTREPAAPAVQGHIYLVHTKDMNSDLVVIFRADRLWPGDKVEISWARLAAAGPQKRAEPAH